MNYSGIKGGSDALNQTIKTSADSSSSEWKLYHTAYAVMVKVCGDLLAKCVIVYYRDYEAALALSNTDFTWIIVCNQVGALVATLILPIINQLLPSLVHKATFFGVFSGIFGVLFFIPSQIEMTTSAILIYLCLDQLLFGICYILWITSIMDLASLVTQNSGNQGSVIALLSLSWTFASMLYVAIGFMIQEINWWASFVLFGGIVSFGSLLSPIFFNFSLDASSKNMLSSSPLRAPFLSQSASPFPEIHPNNTNTAQYFADFSAIFSSKFCVFLYFASFAMGIFMGSFTITIGSIWLEDIFAVKSSEVGIISLAIFVGELISALSLSTFIDKFGVYTVSSIPFLTLLLVSTVCCILSLSFGAAVGGGISVVIVFTFLLYYGWESFFICHQMLCIQNAPKKELVSLTLLIFFVSLNAGSIVGTQISPILWDGGKGLPIISAIWIACRCVTVSIYVFLNKLQKNKEETSENQEEYERV